METKLYAVELYCGKIRHLFDDMLVVDAYGRMGGIVLCWTTSIKLTMNSFSMNHIVVTM